MPNRALSLTAVLLFLVLSMGCQSRSTEKPASAGAASSLQPAIPDSIAVVPTYTANILPILEQHCNGCHAWMKDHHSIMAQTSKETVTRGLRIVYATQPDSSVIIWRLEGKLPSGEALDRMPKGKSPLPADSIGKIRTWIQHGAPDTPKK